MGKKKPQGHSFSSVIFLHWNSLLHKTGKKFYPTVKKKQYQSQNVLHWKQNQHLARASSQSQTCKFPRQTCLHMTDTSTVLHFFHRPSRETAKILNVYKFCHFFLPYAMCLQLGLPHALTGQSSSLCEQASFLYSQFPLPSLQLSKAETAYSSVKQPPFLITVLWIVINHTY